MHHTATALSIFLSTITAVTAVPFAEPQRAGSSFRVSSNGGQHARTPAQELDRALARAGHDPSELQKLRKRQISLPSLLPTLGSKVDFKNVVDQASSLLAGPQNSSPTTLTTSTTSSSTTGGSSAAGSQSVADAVATTNGATSVAGQDVQQPSSSDLTGEAVATEAAQQDQYIETILVGSQSHQLQVAFDTGSTDLWFYDLSYNETNDKNFATQPGETFNIKYGDGTWANAEAGRTSITIGGITAPKMAVGVVEKPSDVDADMVASMAQNNMQGYMGLAFTPVSAFAPVQQPSFFETVLNSLDEPVFTVDLVDSAKGTYTFGQIEPTDYSGASIVWAPLNKDVGLGRWAVSSSDIYVRHGAQPSAAPSLPAAANSVTVFDTGTTLILMEPALVNAYYDAMNTSSSSSSSSSSTSAKGQVRADPASGAFTFPCTADPPALTLGFASLQIAVDNVFAPLADGSDYCTGALQSNGDPGDHSKRQILGAMFFRSAFVAFDAGSAAAGSAAAVGIAEKAAGSALAPKVLGAGTV